MKARTASRLAWSMWGLYVLAVGPLVYVGTIGHNDFTETGGIAQIVAFFGIITVGAFVASRRPENPLGWLFCALALGLTCIGMASSWGDLGLLGRSHPLKASIVAEWFAQWLWFPLIALQVSFPILLFPTGHLPSRRWRPVAWVAVGTLIMGSLSFAFYPWKLEAKYHFLANPYGVRAARGVLGFGGGLALFLVVFLAFASLLSLVMRFRAANREERQQLKWFFYPAALFVASIIGGGIVGWSDSVGNTIYAVVTALLPVAAGLAILKYRLYDIDVVINKTLVYALLAAFITAVYVAIVVGIGQAIGSKGNLGLSILATAVVAVGFQPVRARVQRLANRLVYGKRATPYEVLSEFSERMSGSYATEDLLPRMARILGEGTGASQAEVWIRVASELRPGASWPTESPAHGPIPMSDSELPTIEGVDRALPVRHQGELLGALAVAKSRGDPLRPAEEKLMEDLASGAGLVLRNVRLTAELLARLEELKASRMRIVAAQDEERRRLERNLHDGAQQQLVSLQVKLSLAERLAEEDCRVKDSLASLKQEATEALENLRDLARGIYPPLLADQGLHAALTSQARKATFPVSIEADLVSRYPQDQEAAVYFCCLEALQNVAKYAGATHAAIRLAEEDGHLTFTVTDNGAGFDSTKTSYGTGLQGMADRLSAQGGTLEVRSAPGEGTTVMGRVPVPQLESREEDSSVVGVSLTPT